MESPKDNPTSNENAYSSLTPTEHVNHAAANGDLTEMKLGLQRFNLSETIIASILRLAEKSQGQEDFRIEIVLPSILAEKKTPDANELSTNEKLSIDEKPRLRYDLIEGIEHVRIAAFNGDLEQLKLGLKRIDIDRVNFSYVINLAAINHHEDCVRYLMELSAEQALKEAAKREAQEKKDKEAPSSHKKVCPACGPVVTRYSNCPRCWGPINKQKYFGE